MIAREFAGCLVERGLPEPPDGLVKLIRGKRDRVSPALKTQAIVAGFVWNDRHAWRRAKALDDATRDAIYAKAGLKTHYDWRLRVLNMYAEGKAPDQIRGERKLRDLEITRELLKADYIDPTRAWLEERNYWFDLQPHEEPIDLQRQSSGEDEAWERFVAWKTTLRGGGAALAAAIANVSPTAAAKWLKRYEQELGRIQDADPYFGQMQRALTSCMPKKTA